MKEFCIRHSGRVKGDNGINLRKALEKEFKIKNRRRDLPQAGTINRFIKNWSLTGNINKKKKEMKKRKKFREIVEQSFKDIPNESYRKMALRISRKHGSVGKTTLWRIRRVDLKLYPYRQKKAPKLTTLDANSRLSYCVKVSTLKISGKYMIDYTQIILDF